MLDIFVCKLGTLFALGGTGLTQDMEYAMTRRQWHAKSIEYVSQ